MILALGAVGAGMGFAAFGTATFLGVSAAAWGWTIGSTLGGLLGSKGEDITQEGARLQDLRVQSSTYGVPLAQVYGQMRVAGNIIWSSGLIETRHEDEQESGGKGGGGGSVTSIYYTYSASFAIGICEGPIKSVRRIWADGRLIWSGMTTASVETLSGSAGNIDGYTVYVGNETQTPDPVMESYLGAGSVPAYRGLAYIVFNNLQLGDYGNRIPNIEVEVIADGTETYPRVVKTFVAGQTLNYNNIEYLDGVLVGADANLGSGYPSGTNWTFTKKQWDLNGTLLSTVTSSGWWAHGGGYSAAIGNNPYCIGPVGLHYVNSTTAYFYDFADAENPRQTTVTYPWTPYSGPNRGVATGQRVFIIATPGSPYQTYVMKFSQDGNVPEGPAEVFAITTSDGHRAYWQGTNLYWDGSYLWIWIGQTINDAAQFTSQRELQKRDASMNLLAYWRDNTLTNTANSAPMNGFFVSNGNFVIPQYDGTGTSPAKQWRLNADGTVTYLGAAFMGTGAAGTSCGYKLNGLLVSANGILSPNPVITADNNTVAMIITDIMLRDGWSAGDFDVTDAGLTDLCYGYIVNGLASTRAKLEPLLQAYYIDVVETGGKIKFVKRGKSSVVSIPQTDLAAHAVEDERPPIVDTTRIQETEMPREVRVQYFAKDADYQQGTQSTIRPSAVVKTKNVASYSFPIAMSNSQARQIAEVIMTNTWNARETIKVNVGNKYLKVEPADVITIEGPTKTVVGRVVEITNKLPGLLELAVVPDSPASYVSNATSPDVLTQQVDVALKAPMLTQFIDGPLLLEDKDDYGYYLAGSAYSSSWKGGVVFRSDDNGQNYYAISTLSGKTIVGQTTTKLAAPTMTTVLDTTNTVNVRLVSGTLSSINDTTLMNTTTNTALIGDSGRWELIQFQNATLQGDGTYTLSNIIRGLKGTEWTCSLHGTYDKFILLNTKTMNHVTSTSSENGISKYYKGVTNGMSLSSATPITFTNNNVALKCLSPAHLKAKYETNTDWTISWIRRQRKYGEWLDFNESYLDETTELYDIEIYDGATLKRTITDHTTTSYTYTAALQTTDTTNGKVIIIKVYQKSSRVGRGYVAQITARPPDKYADVIFAANPTSYWRLNENTGSTVITDEIGTHHLTVNQTAQYTFQQASLVNSSTTNKCIKIGSSSNYASLYKFNTALATGSADRTVEFFMKTGSSVFGGQTLFGYGSGSSMGWFRIRVKETNPRSLEIHYATQIAHGSTTLAINTTYHVVIVQRGPKALNGEIWINGVKETMTFTDAYYAASTGDYTLNTTLNGGGINIGCRVDSSANPNPTDSMSWSNFNSYIDEVSYYDRALSAAEIADHYSASL